MLNEERGKNPAQTRSSADLAIESAQLKPAQTQTDGDTYQPFTDLPDHMQGLYAPKASGALAQSLTNLLFAKLIPGFFGILRTIAPIVRFPFSNTIIMTRFDDVQEVFCRKDDFFVPYERMSTQLNWDPSFLLALKKDDATYKDMLRDVRRLWSDDDLQRITNIADGVSNKALKANGGRIDAVQDLMVPVVLHVIQDYYGIPLPGLEQRDAISNRERTLDDMSPEERHDLARLDAFIAGNIAIAGYLFGPQTLSKKKLQNIHWACNSVWPILYDAVNNAGHKQTSGPETLIERARRLRQAGEMKISDAALRSYLMGMIVGFLPTNTNANGRSFDVLMKRNEARKAAQEAVDHHDDDALLGMIYEALRLQYILPGVWREMAEDQQIGIGTKHPKTLDSKRLIYISGLSAMLDPRRVAKPRQFVADRPRDAYLIYGHRMHYCVGAHLSDKMMLAMFKALLGHRACYMKGHKLKFRGNMPWNLIVTYNNKDT